MTTGLILTVITPALTLIVGYLLGLGSSKLLIKESVDAGFNTGLHVATTQMKLIIEESRKEYKNSEKKEG